MLQLSKLAVGYSQKTLLAPIEANAKEGTLIGVLGINGIGKSTLLKTITGLLQPVAGKVEINGENIHKLSPQKRSALITIAGTERELIPFMTVREFIQLGRFRFENTFSFQPNYEKTNAIIWDLNLTHIAEKQLNEISDGERQKATIARALAQDTTVLVLDEPTAFLDYKNKNFVFEKLKQIAFSENKIIILSTHDLETAFKYCIQWWLINESRKFDAFYEAEAVRAAIKYSN